MDQHPSNAQDDNPLRAPYGYGGSHNDSFNSFLNNDHDPTFNQSWDSQPFDSHPESATPYDQSGHGWHQNALQTAKFQHMPNYGIHNASIDPALASKKPSAYALPPPQPITRQDWRTLSSVVPDGKVQGNFVVKSNAEFAAATGTKHLAGFTFVGSNSLEVGTTKATVPKYNRRRSRNEIRRLLLQEKGTGPWPPSREPLLKKLKISAKSLISRPSPAGSRGISTADSPSSIESSSESEPDGDDSEYETGSEQEVEPEEPSPLPSSRPMDPIKAVEYDAVKAVWAKRKVILSGIVIRTALGEYWNVMKGIRDKWKAEVAVLQQASEKQEKAKVIEYERRAANQRKLLESCIRLTLKHGHPDIIEKLGENPILSVVFYNFVADRFKESDYTGSLVTVIMELMSRFVTIDQAILEKTKMDKVLPRIVKRGDEQGKAFAQKVLDNAAAVSKQKSLDSKTSQSSDLKDTTAKKAVNGSKASTETSAGGKRPQVSGEAGSQSLKKAASSNSSNSAAANAKGGIATSKKPSVTDPKAADKGAAIANTAAKVKTNVVTPKTTSFFSSLQSASKKPGTSNAALKSARSKESKDGDALDGKAHDAGAAGPKPAFSFAETLANLSKSKESAPSKSEEDRAPETPEERKKRLRKEDRRKLRVSFKPDDSLVSIRIFEHDPDEEMGHDDSMVRDANDIKGEGQMLKMHRERDMTDEDDDGEATEEVLRAWTAPTLVDLSILPSNELDLNYVSRGGRKQPISPEREIQEQRELNSLMVIYTFPSDIPPSPREPLEQESENFDPEQAFGSPSDETKKRESQYYSAQNSQQGHPAATTQAPDISQLLKLLNPQQNPAAQPQVQQQPAQPNPNSLEAIIASLSNSQQQAPQMQAQPIPQQAPPSAFDYNAAMAVINHAQNRPVYNQPPQPAPTVDLSSILAKIGQSQPAAPTQSYGYGNAYQNENERKRPMDHDGQPNGDYGYSKGKRVKSGTGDKKKPFYGIPHLPCRFWQEGKCRKGDDHHNLNAMCHTTSDQNAYASIKRLIIVCCHAIWLGGPSNGRDETEWAIEPFQQGEIPTLIEHIKEGLKALHNGPESLLVFSGYA
ncbi:MAG: hypothetical protein Q9179_003011 [Wetmoreana sp. 5 TL-2023]